MVKVFLKAFLFCPLFTDCYATFLFINNMKIFTHVGLHMRSTQTFSNNSISHVKVLVEAMETFTLEYSKMIPQLESTLKGVSKICMDHISPLGQQETYFFLCLISDCAYCVVPLLDIKNNCDFLPGCEKNI